MTSAAVTERVLKELWSVNGQSPVARPDYLEEARERWCSEFPPLDHQLTGLAMLMEHSEFLIGDDMGLGKSAIVAVRLRMGFDDGEWTHAAIVAPKSMIGPTEWPLQLQVHGGLPKHKIFVFAGTKAQREVAFDRWRKFGGVLISNYDLVRDHATTLVKARPGVVVADEVHRIKDVGTQAWRGCYILSRDAADRWGLSGTPCPNSPLDLFGVYSFLDARTGRILGTASKTVFRSNYALMGGFENRQVISWQNLKTLKSLIAPHTRTLKKDDVLDLPDRTFIEKQCELAGEQAVVYQKLRDEMVAELKREFAESGRLTAANVLSKQAKLLQICGGLVIDDDKELHRFKPNPKLDLLRDCVDSVDHSEQIILWCAYRGEADLLYRTFGEQHCAYHHGGLSGPQREEAKSQFKSGAKRFLVSTAASLREGVTLVNAAYSFYFSRSWNSLDFTQSCDRNYRLGTTRKVFVYILTVAGTVDEKVAKALKLKVSLQDALMSGNVESLL